MENNSEGYWIKVSEKNLRFLVKANWQNQNTSFG